LIEPNMYSLPQMDQAHSNNGNLVSKLNEKDWGCEFEINDYNEYTFGSRKIWEPKVMIVCHYIDFMYSKGSMIDCKLIISKGFYTIYKGYHWKYNIIRMSIYMNDVFLE
jgi:hypothetical protein